MTTQASTTYKPENKPVGSTNVIYNFDNDRFWMAIEEAVDRTNLVNAEPDPMLGTINLINDMQHREREETELDEGELAGAVITPGDDDNWICIELYNSGTT